MDTVGIANAPHWLNHSIVTIKADYTAGDQAWILNQITLTPTDDAHVTERHQDILKVKRMVLPGSVVAVPRPGGRTKTVNLPQEASQLLVPDLDYIVSQIDAANKPMTAEEQAAFLASASAPSGGN